MKLNVSQIKLLYNNLFVGFDQHNKSIDVPNFCGIKAFAKKKGATGGIFETLVVNLPMVVINPMTPIIPLSEGVYSNIQLTVYMDKEITLDLGPVKLPKEIRLKELFVYARDMAEKSSQNSPVTKEIVQALDNPLGDEGTRMVETVTYGNIEYAITKDAKGDIEINRGEIDPKSTLGKAIKKEYLTSKVSI